MPATEQKGAASLAGPASHRHWPNPPYLRDVAGADNIFRYGKEEKVQTKFANPRPAD